jgi:PmbA protein
MAIRVYIRRGMGYAAASGLEQRDIDLAVEKAVAYAREADPDDDFKGLPQPQDAPEVEGLFDEAVAAMDTEQLVRIVAANLDGATVMEPDVGLSGHVGLSVGEGALASSTGVALESRGTSVEASFEALVRRGEQTGYSYDFDFGRNLADVQLERVAEGAIVGARRYLGTRRVHSGCMPLVLGPLAAYGFLGSIASAANAESVQRGRSFFCDKLGKRIASEQLTLVDDGLIPRGMRSGAHDGEGTKRRPVTIVQKGRLVSLLHNSYTAGKANTESTGHGTHSGGISPTNLCPTLGGYPAAKLIREVNEGMYLDHGEIRPNPTSGEISACIGFGFHIKDGQILCPADSIILQGNIAEWMRNLDAVSSDAREEPGALLPTLRIQNVQIDGVR